MAGTKDALLGRCRVIDWDLQRRDELKQLRSQRVGQLAEPVREHRLPSRGAIDRFLQPHQHGQRPVNAAR